jgi:hypothetical protein
MIRIKTPAVALASVVAFCASVSVHAQETPAAAQPAASAPAPASETQCELHVWPAERFSALTTGWLSGFGVVGALADASAHAGKDKSNRTQMASALDPQGQLDALSALQLTELLHAKPGRIVLHQEPLDRKTVTKIATRRAQSASPCYSELIVADIFYHKAAIYGRSLRTQFLYRDFGAATAKPWTYKSWGGNGLKLFPAKEGEDVQAANRELVDVFSEDFEDFAHKEQSAASKRH